MAAQTRARDTDNRKNHMHRHFGMTGIIRAGGEPPDEDAPGLPEPRKTTNASVLSGSPRERDEHPQKRQLSPASVRSIDEILAQPNTNANSKFAIKKKFKGARQTNKPPVALREMSRREKAAVVERLVMEGSIE